MPDETNAQHMERMRATLRRSAYERVLDKIATLQAWERATQAGTKVDKDGCEFQPMTENERDQLRHLVELRDVIRREMIEHGQIVE